VMLSNQKLRPKIAGPGRGGISSSWRPFISTAAESRGGCCKGKENEKKQKRRQIHENEKTGARIPRIA